MEPLAKELNEALEGTAAFDLLSAFGRRIYFPKGIVAQAAEAKKHKARLNATAGIATLKGEAVHLPAIKELIKGLAPNDIFPYASTQGNQELREMWKREMLQKNPGLEGKSTTLPIVVAGLTHGISVLGDLFVDQGDAVIFPDLYWDNYPLVFQERNQGRLVTFPFFNASGAFNLESLRQALTSVSPSGKVVLVLNFPNNPTGYSPSAAEASSIVSLLREAAEGGLKLLVILDDAYFGLFYEPEANRQSLFADLAAAHPRILAAKVDGPTKEDLVWGFRIGFLTFAGQGLADKHLEALTQKLMGTIRSSVSNSNQLGQSLLLAAMKSPSYEEEKARAFRIMEERYRKVRTLIRDRHPVLEALPFNSGYFMTFRLEKGSSEELRRTLLLEEGVAAISFQDRYLRVAYSSVDLERLEELYSLIYKTAERLFK